MASREDGPQIDCAAALRALNELLSIPACRLLSDRAIDAVAQQANSESIQLQNANLIDVDSYFDPAICPAQVEENTSVIDCRDLLDGLTVQPVLNEHYGSAVRATLTRLRFDVWHGAHIGESSTLCRRNSLPVRFAAISERKDYARDKTSDNMVRLRGLFRTVAYLKICIKRAKFGASPAGKIARSIDAYSLLHARQVLSINGNPARVMSTLASTKSSTSKKQNASRKALMRIPAGSPPLPPRSMTARQTDGAAVLHEAASILQRARQNSKEHVHLQCNRAANAFWNRVCQRAVQRVVLTIVGRTNSNNERNVIEVAASALHQNKSRSSHDESRSHIRTSSRCVEADSNEEHHLFVHNGEELEWREKVQRRLNLEQVQLNAVLHDTGWINTIKSARHEAKRVHIPAQNVGSPVLEALRRYATKNIIRCTPTVRSVLEVICTHRRELRQDMPIRMEEPATHEKRPCSILPINDVMRTTCTDVRDHEACENSHNEPREFWRTPASENYESPILQRDECGDYGCGDTRVASLKPRKPSGEHMGRHGQWRHPQRDFREWRGNK